MGIMNNILYTPVFEFNLQPHTFYLNLLKVKYFAFHDQSSASILNINWQYL